MSQPLTATLNNLKDDVAELVHFGKKTTRHLVDKSPLKETVDKVHNFVLEHPDIFFWGSHAVNAFLSPLAFTVGTATGLGLSLAHRMGATKLSLNVVKNASDKATFSYVNLVALLVLGGICRGFMSGYIAGDYVANFGSYEKAMEGVKVLRETFQEVEKPCPAQA